MRCKNNKYNLKQQKHQTRAMTFYERNIMPGVFIMNLDCGAQILAERNNSNVKLIMDHLTSSIYHF
jgi:hypothetical protein